MTHADVRERVNDIRASGVSAPVHPETHVAPPTPMRIAILAGVRFSTAEPHAGGLERHTDTLARELVRLGHDVSVFAGSREELDDHDVPYAIAPLVERRFDVSPDARADVSMPTERFMIEHDAYLDVLGRLDDFDVVHNNSLHYLPVVTPSQPPVVHTLHTPPTPWLESAYRIRAERRSRSSVFDNSHVASVSQSNAAQWRHQVDQVIHNGVQLDRWRPGSGAGGYAIWSGRIVPEKGLHDALDAAARVGVDLEIAGPVHDLAYFDEQIVPRLRRTPSATYHGHLHLDALAELTANATVAVITPCWEEPFGLVAAEALACGTPIAAFDRGALREIVTDDVGAVAAPDDAERLADAIVVAATRSRGECRRRAVEHFSAAVMARRYVSAYARHVVT